MVDTACKKEEGSGQGRGRARRYRTRSLRGRVLSSEKLTQWNTFRCRTATLEALEEKENIHHHDRENRPRSRRSPRTLEGMRAKYGRITW